MPVAALAREVAECTHRRERERAEALEPAQVNLAATIDPLERPAERAVGLEQLIAPEELGGAGGELADAAAVMTELGRGLVPTPLLGTILAELALLAAEIPDADILEQLAAGAVIGTVVFDPDYVLYGDTAEVVVTTWNTARATRAAREPKARTA